MVAYARLHRDELRLALAAPANAAGWSSHWTTVAGIPTHHRQRRGTPDTLPVLAVHGLAVSHRYRGPRTTPPPPPGGRSPTRSRPSSPPTRGPRGNGYAVRMRIGDTEVRFLGGGLGCLGMILFSILASVLLTVLINVVW